MKDSEGSTKNLAKRTNIIELIIIIVLVMTIVSAISSDFLFPKISTPESLTIEYLEEIPLKEFKITDRAGNIKYTPKQKNLKYDKELVNEPQTATLKSGLSSSKPFNLMITPKKIAKPNISIKDEVLIIEKQEHSDLLEIYIDDNIITTQQLSYNLEYLSVGSHQVKGRYLALNDKFENSDFSDEIIIKKISAVDTISYDGTKLMWSARENAEKYEVIVNGEINETFNTYLNYEFSVGVNSVKIRAININETIFNSDYKNVEFIKLEKVRDIDFANGRISWKSGEIDYSYRVIVNKTEYIVENNYLDIHLKIGTNNISVQTVDENNVAIASDIESSQINYNKISAPLLSIIESDDPSKINVKIKSVKDADVYNLYIKKFSNDSEFVLATATCDADENIEIDIEKYVKFEIYAAASNYLNKHEASDYSSSLIIKKLNLVDEIKYEDGKIKWSNVANASKYELQIDDVLYETKNNEITYDLKTGINKIKIRALGNRTNYLNGDYSNKEFKKLADVTNIFYSDNRISWNSIEVGYKYLVMVNYVQFITSKNYLDITLSGNSNYVEIQVFDENNEAFPSNFVIERVGQYKLDSPSIEIEQGLYWNSYKLIVSPVDHADSYELNIILYAGDTIQSTYAKKLTDKLDLEFYIDEETTRIIVNVLAKDSDGFYSESNLVIKEKDL